MRQRANAVACAADWCNVRVNTQRLVCNTVHVPPSSHVVRRGGRSMTVRFRHYYRRFRHYYRHHDIGSGPRGLCHAGTICGHIIQCNHNYNEQPRALTESHTVCSHMSARTFTRRIVASPSTYASTCARRSGLTGAGFDRGGCHRRRHLAMPVPEEAGACLGPPCSPPSQKLPPPSPCPQRLPNSPVARARTRVCVCSRTGLLLLRHQCAAYTHTHRERGREREPPLQLR